MGVGAQQVQGLVEPVHGVGVAVSHDPVAAERRRHRERPFGARLRDRPSESRVEVVDLGVVFVLVGLTVPLGLALLQFVGKPVLAHSRRRRSRARLA